MLGRLDDLADDGVENIGGHLISETRAGKSSVTAAPSTVYMRRSSASLSPTLLDMEDHSSIYLSSQVTDGFELAGMEAPPIRESVARCIVTSICPGCGVGAND